MNNSTYFFSPYMPSESNLTEQYMELVLKYPDIDRYLYTTTLSKIMASLDSQDQKKFLIVLDNSEEAAQRWLASHTQTETVVRENLERSILALHAQLL